MALGKETLVFVIFKFQTVRLPVMFPNDEIQNKSGPNTIYFSSHIRYIFRTNMVIPHAGHKKKEYTNIYTAVLGSRYQ